MQKNKSIITTEEKIKRALLVATYQGTQKQTVEEHLEELALLVETFGANPAEKITTPLRKVDASTFISSGKLEELIQIAQNSKIDLIIFDDNISPSQQRNLEKAFNLSVLDRTEVILEVFAQRAQTKEARLQIELAKVKYEYPRLKRLWTHLSRQSGTSGGGGGGAYLKGEGEKQIEIDRRLVKRKIEKLQQEIDEFKGDRLTQRSLRDKNDIPIFGIIGYTNAGKSTLLNALTDANVFVEDKLFATLDTTTRKYVLSNNQEVLLIDTVGFIRKLPHLLVAAFRSTLEEAFEADILLHLIDVSHPLVEEQAQATFDVLKELNAENKPIITVLNKIDKVQSDVKRSLLRHLFPKSVEISALNKTGLKDLEDMMIQELSKQRKMMYLRVPQSEYGIVSDLMRLGNILQQEYEDNDVILSVDVPTSLEGKLKKYTINKETAHGAK